MDVGGEKGLGVVATESLRKGEIVCSYPGQLISGDLGMERFHTYNKLLGSYLYFFDHGGKRKCIDATCSGGVGRFINHSRKQQNLKPVCMTAGDGTPSIQFKLLRDVAPGQELLYDYGERDPSIHAIFPWLKA